MRTEIFDDYAGFLGRKDKTVNGVSKGFARNNPNYEIDNKTNKGCWNCTGCISSEGCQYCNGCISCYDGWSCTGCISCEKCIGCIVAISCYDCNRCQGCISCHKCNNCSNCIGRSLLDDGIGQ